MTHALQIDTLEFSKKLKAAGADEKLADAIVEGLAAADISNLATKTDIAELRTELKTEIAEVRSDLLKYMVWLFIAQAGLLIGILKLFPL